MKYERMVTAILHHVGGKENITNLTHCYTRLRFVLKDNTKADKDELGNIKGVKGVVEKGGQLQIVIGNEVTDVYDEFCQMTGLKESGEQKNEKKSFIDTISAIFFPIIGLMCASGLIKGLLALLVACGALSDASTTYTILNGVGDTIFYYLPAFLGYTTAKRFNGSPFLGMAIGLALVYPNILALSSAEPISVLFEGTPFASNVTATILGIPTIVVNYSSSVFPVIIAVLAAVQFEKLVAKYTPKVVKSFLPACLTLLIMVPLTLIVIGPIVSILSNMIANGISAFYGFSPILASILLAAIFQILIMFGLHGMLFPIIFMNIGMMGYDIIFPACFVCSFTQIACCLALSIRQKDVEQKSIATSAGISAIFGITEPAIYGVTLPNKKAFISSVIASAMGGIVIGIAQVKMYVLGGMGIIGFLNFVSGDGNNTQLMYVVLAVCVAMVAAFILTFVLNKNIGQPAAQQAETDVPSADADSAEKTVYAPVCGSVRALDTCTDETFASGMLGKGVVVTPTEGTVYAPFDGVINTVFPTKHAIAFVSDTGVEVLVHVGIDTVNLKGKHFNALKEEGARVKQCEKVLEFDIAGIQKEGYSTEVPVIITNSDEYADMQFTYEENSDNTVCVVKVS